MKDEKLKPCPFCGGRAMAMDSDAHWTQIVCLGCGCRTPFTPDREKAVMLWNKRTTDSERKTGRWIRMKDSDDGFCSNCKCDMPLFREDWTTWKHCATEFCPNCGAKMANWDGLEEEPEDDGK